MQLKAMGGTVVRPGGHWRGGVLLAGFAGLSLLGALFAQHHVVRIGLWAGVGTFGAMALGFGLVQGARWVLTRHRRRLLAQMVLHEPAYCFVTNVEGEVLAANVAAQDRFGGALGQSLDAVLHDVFASAEGMVGRLRHQAIAAGAASEDLRAHAEGFRIYARTVADGLLLWRLESEATRGAADRRADLPMLTLGRNGAVLFMNPAALVLIGRQIRSISEVVSEAPIRNGSVQPLRTEKGEVRVLLQAADIGAGRQELVLAPVEIGGDSADDAGRGFEGLPVPLLKVAPDGTVLRANPEARRLLDLAPGKLGNMAEHMEGLGRAITDWLEEAADGRGQHRSEFLRLTRADREVFVQVTLNRVVENGVPALVAVLNDATELKTLEAQFVQSQKMQAIGQLAGGVAHDFNNLLTAISGHCDLLLLRHDQGDPDYGDLVQINQNANRAAALVGQLLAFSRKQTMRPEVLDLRDTLSDLTHLLNRLVGEKVTLTLRHDPMLPPVRGDRRQLEQVMMNLVVNARDAMPEGGEIIVETERKILREQLERDRARVPPGTYVSVRISDEGIGIPPDKLQKVFEPFFTTKRTGEGTGLGLSTVYGIVKQSGGYVFVDSVLGQGTCFSLLLPAYEKPMEAVTLPEVEQPRRLPDRGSGVVLLVEDEAPVRAFAARALRLRGYSVIEAETGEEALELLEDAELNVDIFVTDVVMPGMDGPTWVRKAQEARPDVRVIFVSGYAEDAFNEGQKAIPNSVFLPKPFSLSDLTETVHTQLS